MSDEEWGAKFSDAGLVGWYVREGTARTTFECTSFAAAGELAARIAMVCDEQGHHAEIDIRSPDQVRVTAWTHDVGGLTDRDLELATEIAKLSGEQSRGT